MSKERLDVFLTREGYFETRSKAQAVIMAGEVLVDDQKVDKPGTMSVKSMGNTSRDLASL